MVVSFLNSKGITVFEWFKPELMDNWCGKFNKYRNNDLRRLLVKLLNLGVLEEYIESET